VVVHLIDGTFERFRYFLSPAAAFDRSAPEELRAVRGVVVSILGMLEGGATHLGMATDHVIESFRNALCTVQTVCGGRRFNGVRAGSSPVLPTRRCIR
jgi:hypothetical protein